MNPVNHQPPVNYYPVSIKKSRKRECVVCLYPLKDTKAYAHYGNFHQQERTRLIHHIHEVCLKKYINVKCPGSEWPQIQCTTCSVPIKTTSFMSLKEQLNLVKKDMIFGLRLVEKVGKLAFLAIAPLCVVAGVAYLGSMASIETALVIAKLTKNPFSQLATSISIAVPGIIVSGIVALKMHKRMTAQPVINLFLPEEREPGRTSLAREAGAVGGIFVSLLPMTNGIESFFKSGSLTTFGIGTIGTTILMIPLAAAGTAVMGMIERRQFFDFTQIIRHYQR